MKIQKSTDAEVFNQYSAIMNSFLKKKASWSSDILSEVSAGLKSLDEALTSSNKTIEEFIQELFKSGKNFSEISKITGKKIFDIENIVSTDIPSNIAPTVKPIQESIPSVISETIEGMTKATDSLKLQGRELANIALSVSDLEGKSNEEIIELYKSLKKSRDGMKGQITALRNALNKAVNESDISAEELSVMSETLQKSQRLLMSSEDEVTTLLKKLDELGSKLDASGNVIKGLEQELNVTKKEVSNSQKIIQDLTSRGLQLEEENKKLLEQIAKQTEIAAYNQEMQKALKNTGEENSIAGKITQEVQANAIAEANKATEKLLGKKPELSKVIPIVTERAAVNGKSIANQSLKGVGIKLPGAQNVPDGPPVPEPVKVKPIPATTEAEQDLPQAPAVGPQNTGRPLGSAIPPVGNKVAPRSPTVTPIPPKTEVPKTEVPKTEVPKTEVPKTEVPKTEAPKAEAPSTKVKKSDNPNIESEKTENEKINSKVTKPSLLQQLILKNSPKLLGEAASSTVWGASKLLGGGIYLLKFMALATMIAGAYLAYKYWSQQNPQEAEDTVKNIRTNQYDALNKLKNLNFKENSLGEQYNKDLINKITNSFRSVSLLSDYENLTEENYNKVLSDLDELEMAMKEYVDGKDAISKDLTSSEGFDGAILSLNNLSDYLNNLKQNIINANQNYEEVTAEEGKSHILPVPNQRGIANPIGKESPISQEKSHFPHEISVGDQIIDIGNLSRGARSSAPRIVEKVINTPEGLAFLDPDNLWGGWLQKTPQFDSEGNQIEDKSADYLRAIKYLYLNKIFDRHDLRKFVRENLPKVGRKRMSGWKDAIKYYSGKTKNYTKKQNNKKITQNFEKPANYNKLDVIHKQERFNDMKKKADTISKEYFQDAIIGLEDQYAKSYYAGLKSMHEAKPEKTEADYKKLYNVHSETGADLIENAHPFSIDIADAMGNGGIVENKLEQQRHNIGVAKSMPSGNIRGKHAWLIKNLIKLADYEDEAGNLEASDLIDAAIKELS